MYQVEKKYGSQLDENSDKALLLDPNNATCLVSRAMHYIHEDKPADAVPYLEKALLYNPNHVDAFNFLSTIYNFIQPNTSKHLRNALKAARLDIGVLDSAAASYNFMQLSVAFLQAGFQKEAQLYIDKAQAYDKNNQFVNWVRAGVLVATKRDYVTARDIMKADYEKDTTRIHFLQEIAKVEYVLGNFESSYQYYKRFNAFRDAMHLEVFEDSNLTIGVVYYKMGNTKEGERYIRKYLEFAEKGKTIYKNIHLAMYYAWKDDVPKAIEHLKLFAREDDFQYWVLLLESDHIAEKLKNNEEFKKVMKEIADKFHANTKKIRKELEEEGLI